MALRRAADSIWRTYVVTPWCIGEFGSLAGCRKYGLAFLAEGGDADRRSGLIFTVVDPAEDGGNSPTARWVTGDHLAGRAEVVLLALVTAVPFALLLVFLALAALIAALSVIALGVLGPLFLLCWPIRGRPRQIGTRWIEALVGAVLQGVAVTAVLGVTLVMSSLIVRLSDKYGYALVSVLNITATATAFRYRRMLENILGTAMPGVSSPMVGLAALWGGRALVRKAATGWRAPHMRWPTPRPAPLRPRPARGPARALPNPLRPHPGGPAGDRSPVGPRTPRPALSGGAALPAPEPVTARAPHPAILAQPDRSAIARAAHPQPLTASAPPPARDGTTAGNPAVPRAHRQNTLLTGAGTVRPQVRHSPDLPPDRRTGGTDAGPGKDARHPAPEPHGAPCRR